MLSAVVMLRGRYSGLSLGGRGDELTTQLAISLHNGVGGPAGLFSEDSIGGLLFEICYGVSA